MLLGGTFIEPAYAGGWAYANRVCNSDLQCDDAKYCNGLEHCDPSDRLADSHGCAPGTRPPVPSTWPASVRARAVCDESKGRYVLEGADADHDGHDSIADGGDDCNDHDASSYPGNVELCDARGHDEDCDPTTVGRKDSDGDGYNDSACFNVQPDGSRYYDTARH